MRAVFLAHNGIGLGHLVRLSQIARAADRAGAAPVFFCQSPSSASSRQPFPTAFVPSLLDATAEACTELRDDLVRYLETGDGPSILVEDTHPCKLVLPPSVVRALIVRPGSWEYLQQLQTDFRHVYQAFFVADSPDSPTWPYTDEQTAVIESWPSWRLAGPVYRRPSAEEVAQVRQRLGYNAEARVCVFTMGGGGQHPENSDVAAFLKHAMLIGGAIRSRDPHARLVFVRGPLFPQGEALPSVFEVLDEEPDMHALLAAARLAVLRPGFNTTWECLAAGTVIYPILGTSYAEPMDIRLGKLRATGLVPDDPLKAWEDETWRVEYQTHCKSLNPGDEGAEHRIARGLLALGRESCRRPDPVRASRRVLILTINGIGIGHIVRSARLAQALIVAGHECFILVETANKLVGTANAVSYLEGLKLEMFPCPAATIPHAFHRSKPDPSALSQLESLLHEFDPDIVVQDCHTPMKGPAASISGLRTRYRLAIHSTPSIATLQQIMVRTDADFSFLLHGVAEHDALYGPTVPLATLPSTIGLAGGPLSNGPSLHTQAFSRPLPKHRFALIVLGGGGDHPGRQDTKVISHMLGDIAEYAWRVHGLETICASGPLFTGLIHPEHPAITMYSYIHNLDSFIAAADIVVARPGFNLARDVIGRNRVVFLNTYQYEEASTEQMAVLSRFAGVRYASCEPDAVIGAMEQLLQQTEPVPPVLFGDGLPAVLEHIRTADCETIGLRSLRELLSSFRERPLVSIRVDDVETLDSFTGSCVRDLLAMGAHLSIEVIPYSQTLSGASLDALDPEGRLEVGQHGYSHLPRVWPGSRRGEFNVYSDSPKACELKDLAKGQEILTNTFGPRFAGGFSTPFDALPKWLPAVWEQLGGRYLSYVWHRPHGARLPVIQFSVEPWDWDRERRWSAGEICRMTSQALIRRGQVGFVLHPERFARSDWSMLQRLLATLFEGGAMSQPPYRVASLQAQRVTLSSTRRYAAGSA